jgi:hypothetical protein
VAAPAAAGVLVVVVTRTSEGSHWSEKAGQAIAPPPPPPDCSDQKRPLLPSLLLLPVSAGVETQRVPRRMEVRDRRSHSQKELAVPGGYKDKKAFCCQRVEGEGAGRLGSGRISGRAWETRGRRRLSLEVGRIRSGVVGRKGRLGNAVVAASGHRQKQIDRERIVRDRRTRHHGLAAVLAVPAVRRVRRDCCPRTDHGLGDRHRDPSLGEEGLPLLLPAKTRAPLGQALVSLGLKDGAR